ncbi:hypothetical protein [Luteolibacter sp. LG18]|uniref:DUF7133 domain-containing protein n=1 Tax=Luteolibacter sp. LG18 TaxID=2819286 RepID=UPI002B28DCE5|nr:large multi-functional protein [Luteolibacter sp. LG18]
MRTAPCTSLILLATAAAALAAPSFKIEPMPLPEGVDPQIGGVDVLPDGRVATVFHRGEALIFDPAKKTWSRFAEGLHEPLGVLAETTSSWLVMQRSELTRLRDTDGDGTADDYETVFDGFGMTGNYHEFAFGPVKAKDGSLYISLNLASNGAGTAPEVRGPWSDIGALNRQQMVNSPDWKKQSKSAGRMYSRVAWRGWVLRLSPDGKQMEPFACGFRSPDGIGFDADGNLLITDNQGDWRGTSPLYVVKRGGFYGQPASLVWRKDWKDGDPLKLPVAKLESLRTVESARFPQGDLANSPTQPVVIPPSWGPYAGNVLIGEMNQKRMVRYLPDDVGGFRQGALVPMFDGTSLGNGNHRLAFAPDGTLWVGKTHLSWAGDRGLVKIVPQDIASAFTVMSCKQGKAAQSQTLTLHLSQPLDSTPPSIAIQRYGYAYHEDYGSPKTDPATVDPDSVMVSKDGRDLTITLKLTAGQIHELDLSKLKSRDGQPLEGKKVYYQAAKVL